MPRLSRRELFLLVAGAAALRSSVVRAQNPPIPVVGFLHPGAASAYAKLVGAFQDGLKQFGFADGDNVAIAYQWANDDIDRLPALAAELVRSHVDVLAAIGRDPAVAAKGATDSLPIVFVTGEDPIKLGFASSLARPGRNLTGIDIATSALTAKRLALLRQLAPEATRIAVLVDPADAASTAATLANAEQAARWMGLQIRALNASSSDEIDAAFDTIKNERLDVLLVDLAAFFSTRRVQVVNLASSYAVPAIYGGRQFPEAGGLMSYGASLADACRQAGEYVGRILKGESPADMAVAQASKFELVINVRTAKKLGIDVPPALLTHAGDLIE
jgi:putative tryptophan/tyrosine transport system substrate-binding protein